jgi:DNA-binding CsgD family transcriptional regulator
MHSAVQNFVVESNRVSNPDGLHAALLRSLRQLGCDRYIYLRFPEASPIGEALHLTNYPSEWIDRYVEAHHERVDPVLRQLTVSPLPFGWHELPASAPAFMDEAGQVGLRGGLSVPFFVNGKPQAHVTFSSSEPSAEATRVIEANRPQLLLLAMYFGLQVGRVGGATRNRQRPSLTERERECLQWMAAGKTREDIADVLGIAEGTVRSYLQNAYLKLGVSSGPQAIAKALRDSLIAP